MTSPGAQGLQHSCAPGDLKKEIGMAYVVKLLDAADALIDGAPHFLNEPHSRFTMQVVATGSPSSRNVHLEGSLDGTTWFDVGETASVITVVTHQFLFIRVRLTALTGGTSPTISVYVAVGD